MVDPLSLFCGGYVPPFFRWLFSDFFKTGSTEVVVLNWREWKATTTTVDREGRSGDHQQCQRERETGMRKPPPQKERGEEPPPPHNRRRGEEPSQHKRGGSGRRGGATTRARENHLTPLYRLWWLFLLWWIPSPYLFRGWFPLSNATLLVGVPFFLESRLRQSANGL